MGTIELIIFIVLIDILYFVALQKGGNMRFKKFGLAAITFEVFLMVFLGTGGYAFAASAPPPGTVLLSANTPASGYANMSSTSVASATVTNGGTGYGGPQFAYPTGDTSLFLNGSWSYYPASLTSLWDKVDDPAGSPDDATTYIYSTSTNPQVFFTFPAFTIPSNAVDIKLAITYRVKASTSGGSVYGAEQIRNWPYLSGTYATLTTSYATTTYNYLTNPDTSKAWTPGDVNGTSSSPLQAFGVSFVTSSKTVYITQIYAVVTYALPVTISGGGGTGATAEAVTSGGAVSTILITANGSGYTAQPDLVITGGNGDATATANLTGTTIPSVTISDGGAGYAIAPSVVFSGGGGSGVAATATIDDTGEVTAVTMTNEGSGYTSPPAVSFLGLSGNYIGTQYLKSGTTYTPDSGTQQIIIKMLGGGGGGGYNWGSGGGGGGYLEKRIITGAGATATYAIGAAGTAGHSGTNGGNGGDTTFSYNSVIYTAGGGPGGTNGSGSGTTAGGTSTNGDLNITGGTGASANSGALRVGVGTASIFGGQGTPGSGGDGSGATPGVPNAGGAGLIIVNEFD